MASSDAAAQFPIPEKWRAELEPVDVADGRSDAEILAALARPPPVTSEKNLWGFWDKGLGAMPAWCRRNVTAWVRINPGWTVRILNKVPGSPLNARRYVPDELFPAAFLASCPTGESASAGGEGAAMDGPFVGPHSADLVRGACLLAHGGVFLDVGAVLTRAVDRVCWDRIADPASPYNIAAPLLLTQAVGNHLVAARKGDPFIKRWHELFVHVWEGRTNLLNSSQVPVITKSMEMMADDYRPVAAGLWDWKGTLEEFGEYVTQICVWFHLCHLEDAGDGFSCVDYWMNNVFLFNAMEDWPAESVLGFAGAGQRTMDLLSVRRDADPTTEEYRQAEELTFTILARGCMEKVTHGGGMMESPNLGTLWDRPENDGRDCAPGTFAELLRYGAVHFRQTRESIAAVPPNRPAVTFKKGVFDPWQ